MLNWAKQFNIFCLLDNHQYHFSEPPFECLLAAGSMARLQPSPGHAFTALQEFAASQNDWIFGHLCYDLKNEIEELSSQNFDGTGFPDLFFFVPETIVILKKDSLQIGIIEGDATLIHKRILEAIADTGQINPVPDLQSRFSKQEYMATVERLRQHILRGDCYEINFCQEFYAEDVAVNPLEMYEQLSRISPNPFAAFYRLNDKYLLCSSPERYLKKEGATIFSQPIKGTARRDLGDAKNDEQNKVKLSVSKKEIAENVMVVDLVRNDLSKVCIDGSVKVDELFGLYTFPQVHQMISTVSGTLDDKVHLSDILKATFPMGSMTGVPKKSVMQLIEKYERTKRGLFSGAVGYIQPGGDFDFNVVIRSILYNATQKYISIQAGSAITFYSDAATEYEECLLKIEAIKKVLG